MPNKSKNKKAVKLEGRTRLPQRVQDLVIDLGSAVASVQQTSGSNETLVASIRNFAAVDGIMSNSVQNLDKLNRQLDRMEAQTDGIEHGLENQVAKVVKNFDALEQSGYGTVPTTPKKAHNNKNNENEQECK